MGRYVLRDLAAALLLRSGSQLKLGRTAITLMALLTMAVVAAGQVETIDATARGTSTQMGNIGSIKVIITEFSTPEDREVLKEAFLKGGHQGLVKALEKMKSSGRITIPGKVGYDLAYIVMIPTSTGRKIRFATNRKIAFGEAYRNTQSKAFDLTAGEIDINEEDSKKSAGTLFPAAQLIINGDGDLQWELRQNPWQLVNIIDWKNRGK